MSALSLDEFADVCDGNTLLLAKSAQDITTESELDGTPVKLMAHRVVVWIPLQPYRRILDSQLPRLPGSVEARIEA